MSWESIGSTSTGQMPHEEAWIVLSLGLAKRYITFVCGEPPSGSKLDIMWHEHDLGSYPSLGVWSDYDAPWDYINACERALEVFDEAVSWHELKEHFEEQAFPEEDDDVEVEEKNVDDELTKTEGKLPTSQISEDCYMPNEQVLPLDIGAEIDHYFDDSSVPRDEEPRIVILMGGPAVGKTTIRKQCFATGYVLVDAAEIFLSLSHGKFFPFPDAFEQPMDIIGCIIARRAISERRHIVTELIGSDYEPTKNLIEAMRAVGYMVDVQGITCGIEEAQHRNISRGDDNISCYYAEPYQRRWLLEAAYATKS